MTRFLTFLSALALLAGSAVAQVPSWNITTPNHTAAQFSVRHMGISTVRGAFTKVSGTAQFDPFQSHQDFGRSDHRGGICRYACFHAR